jgi:uncharacterized membrane protein
MSFQEFIPPVEIPTLLHFPIVHFATAFLVIAILLEIINIFFKRKILSFVSLLVILLFASLMTLAYLTIGVDGKEIVMIVADSGIAGLAEYKEFGTYLGYGALALVLLKLLFMTLSSLVTRFSFAIMLMGYLVLSVNQTAKGILLKQMHGINGQVMSSIENQRDELKDRYTKLKESCKENSTDSKIAIELKELQEKYNALLLKDNKEQNNTVEPMEEKEPKIEDSKTGEIEKEDEPKVEEHVEVEEEPTKETSTLTISLELPSDINESH